MKPNETLVRDYKALEKPKKERCRFFMEEYHTACDLSRGPCKDHSAFWRKRAKYLQVLLERLIYTGKDYSFLENRISERYAT